jgi:hypothetical protein
MQESQTHGLPVHFTLSAVTLLQLQNVAPLSVKRAFDLKCFLSLGLKPKNIR